MGGWSGMWLMPDTGYSDHYEVSFLDPRKGKRFVRKYISLDGETDFRY